MNLFFRKGKWVLRKGKIPGPNCKDECCSGDGGPGPGACLDPDNCYYELGKCRGVHVLPGQVGRWFISLRDYQDRVDQLGIAPGTCLWLDSGNGPGCFFIAYPTNQTAVPFTQIAPIVASGSGRVISRSNLVVAPDHSCCNGCGTGCLESNLDVSDGVTPITKCCCNMNGACLSTVWSYSWHRRSTNVDDPNNWIDTTILGGGTVRNCFGDPSPSLPTVHVHNEVGPTYTIGFTPDFDLPFGHIVGGGDNGCLGLIPHFSTVGDGVIADDTKPTRSCKTSRWSIIEHEDRIECDSSIPPKCFRLVTDVIAFSNETLSDGSGDCGGGCFDTASPVPKSARPLWVKALSKLAKPEDKGLGDTITRVVGIFGGEVFKQWFKKTTGRACGCESRAAALSAKYPYTK